MKKKIFKNLAVLLCFAFICCIFSACDLWKIAQETEIKINFYISTTLVDTVTIKGDKDDVKTCVPDNTKLSQNAPNGQFLLGWFLDQDYENEFNNKNVAIEYLLSLRDSEEEDLNVYARYATYESLFNYSSVGDPAYAQISGLTDLGKTATYIEIPSTLNYDDHGNNMDLPVNELYLSDFESNKLKKLKITAQVNEIDFNDGFDKCSALSEITFEQGSIFSILDNKFICEKSSNVNQKLTLRYIFNAPTTKSDPVVLNNNIESVKPTANYNIFKQYTSIIVPSSVERIDANYTTEPFYQLDGANPVFEGEQVTYYMFEEWNHDLTNPAPIN